MTQVFARYAKDLLEKQNYPEVRRALETAVAEIQAGGGSSDFDA